VLSWGSSIALVRPLSGHVGMTPAEYANRPKENRNRPV